MSAPRLRSVPALQEILPRPICTCAQLAAPGAIEEAALDLSQLRSNSQVDRSHLALDHAIAQAHSLSAATTAASTPDWAPARWSRSTNRLPPREHAAAPRTTPPTAPAPPAPRQSAAADPSAPRGAECARPPPAPASPPPAPPRAETGRVLGEALHQPGKLPLAALLLRCQRRGLRLALGLAAFLPAALAPGLEGLAGLFGEPLSSIRASLAARAARSFALLMRRLFGTAPLSCRF